MRKRLVYLAAACLGVGGLGVVSSNLPAADVDVRANVGTTQPSGKVSLPEGVTQKDLKEANDIRSGLARYTNDCLTTGGFRSIISQFQDADEGRMKDWASNHKGDLDGQIRAFLGAWKAKYGQDFDANQNKLLTQIWPENNVMIVQGEITDPKMLSNWPVAPTEGVNVPHTPSGDAKDQALDKGRNVALVHLGSEHKLPDLNVSMVSQAGGWVIDVPDNLSAEQFQKNLKDVVFTMGQNLKDFPANINDGYRLASHYLLMAAYNVDLNKIQGGGMRIEGKIGQ